MTVTLHSLGLQLLKHHEDMIFLIKSRDEQIQNELKDKQAALIKERDEAVEKARSAMAKLTQVATAARLGSPETSSAQPARVEELQHTINRLEQEIRDRKDENAKLAKQKSAAFRQAADLKTQLAACVEQLQNLESQNAGLHNTIADLLGRLRVFEGGNPTVKPPTFSSANDGFARNMMPASAPVVEEQGPWVIQDQDPAPSNDLPWAGVSPAGRFPWGYLEDLTPFETRDAAEQQMKESPFRYGSSRVITLAEARTIEAQRQEAECPGTL